LSVEGLDAVDDCTVEEVAELAGWTVGDTEDAEEAASGVEGFAVRAGIEGESQKQGGEAGGEAEGALAECHAGEQGVAEEEDLGGKVGGQVVAIDENNGGDRDEAESEGQEPVVAAGAGGFHWSERQEVDGGAEEGGEDEDEGEFGDGGEEDRGEEGVEKAAENATEGDPEVELGEPGRAGAALSEFSVADHGDGEERGHGKRKKQREGKVGFGEDGVERKEDQQRQAADKPFVRDGWAGGEDEDEAEEIDGEGHDPKERDRGNVGGEFGIDAHHEAGGDEGEGDPTEAAGPGGGWFRIDGRLGGEKCRLGPPSLGCAEGGEEDEDKVAVAPKAALTAEAEGGFEEEWVSE